MPPQQTLIRPGESVLRQTADYFKQGRAHIVVKVLGEKFLLSWPGETGTHVRGKFVSGIGGNRVDKHSKSLRSVAYAAETGVHILVVGLEPVAKRGPKHACGRTHRAPLHDEVLAVEKVS